MISRKYLPFFNDQPLQQNSNTYYYLSHEYLNEVMHIKHPAILPALIEDMQNICIKEIFHEKYI